MTCEMAMFKRFQSRTRRKKESMKRGPSLSRTSPDAGPLDLLHGADVRFLARIDPCGVARRLATPNALAPVVALVVLVVALALFHPRLDGDRPTGQQRGSQEASSTTTTTSNRHRRRARARRPSAPRGRRSAPATPQIVVRGPSARRDEGRPRAPRPPGPAVETRVIA